jgi:hypothetical protein
VVTFLFTDVEGSTRRWETDAAAMRAALLAHDEVLRSAIEGQGGYLFSHTGDGVVAAFASPRSAVDAAVAAQPALELPVRMGIATGEAELRYGDYFGTVLNRAARVMAAGHGGQILVAESTAVLLTGVDLLDLGPRRLRDVSAPVEVFQVRAPGLRTDFPSLRGSRLESRKFASGDHALDRPRDGSRAAGDPAPVDGVVTKTTVPKASDITFPNRALSVHTSGTFGHGETQPFERRPRTFGNRPFSVRVVGGSGRVEQECQHAKDMCGCLAVRHVAERLRNLAKGRGHATAFLQIKSGHLVNQRRRRHFAVSHDPSAAPSFGGLEPCIGIQVTRIGRKEPLPARDPCNALGARRLGGACP